MPVIMCVCVCVYPKPKATRPAATITVTDVKELGRLRKRSAPGTTRPARALNQYGTRAHTCRSTHTHKDVCGARGNQRSNAKNREHVSNTQYIKSKRTAAELSGHICSFLHMNLINQSPDESLSLCACLSPTHLLSLSHTHNHTHTPHISSFSPKPVSGAACSQLSHT